MIFFLILAYVSELNSILAKKGAVSTHRILLTLLTISNDTNKNI